MRISKSNAKSFLINAGIRALKTFFQTFVSVIGVSALLADVNWVTVLSTSALSAIVSIATSFATGLPEVQPKIEEGSDEEK